MSDRKDSAAYQSHLAANRSATKGLGLRPCHGASNESNHFEGHEERVAEFCRRAKAGLPLCPERREDER